MSTSPSPPPSPTPPASTAPINPLKRKTMSLTQTYHLAHLARGKLAHEASRSVHRLHRLVGHANLLDSLMLDLQAAEEEQERWFNARVTSASARATPLPSSAPRRIRWADSVTAAAVEAEEVSDDSDDDSDPAYEMGDDFPELVRVSSHSADASRIPSAGDQLPQTQDDEDDEDDEGLRRLALSLSPPSTTPIPELDSDSDSDDDDEGMPPSPKAVEYQSCSEKQRRELVTTGFYSKADQALVSLHHPSYYERTPTVSVY